MPTVLITGANRGLGLGLTRLYLDDGWSVLTVSRSSSPELDALVKKEHLKSYQCDLTDDDALEKLAGTIGEQPIDILINNAGMMAKAGFSQGGKSVQGFGHFDRDLWQRLFDINLFTPMHLAELFAPNLAASDNGRLVTISSILGSMELNIRGGLYAYRASKAGVNAIMKSMGIDLADRGITAIAMHPGWVQTDMGGKGADLDINTSVTGMKTVIGGLSIADAGRFFSYNGNEMPW